MSLRLADRASPAAALRLRPVCFDCTASVDCGQLRHGGVIRDAPLPWQQRPRGKMAGIVNEPLRRAATVPTAAARRRQQCSASSAAGCADAGADPAIRAVQRRRPRAWHGTARIGLQRRPLLTDGSVMDIASNVALSRLVAQQRAMDVIADNIANANTPGFKAERMQFSDWLSRQTRHRAAGRQTDRLHPGPRHLARPAGRHADPHRQPVRPGARPATATSPSTRRAARG